MLEVVLVVVSAELIEDVPDSVQEPFDLNKHVYDRTYAYDFNNVNTFVTTPCEHVPINKYTHEPAPDDCPYCAGVHSTSYNPDGRWDSLVIGGRSGRHFLHLKEEHVDARLALMRYSDMPEALKSPRSYENEMGLVHVLLYEGVANWPLEDDKRDPTWYYVLCTSHC